MCDTRKRKSGVSCSICKKSKRNFPDLKIFACPSNEKNEILSNLWRQACDFKSEGKYFVCQNHFSSEFIGRKMLKRDAVPSLNLNCNLNLDLSLENLSSLLPKRRRTSSSSNISCVRCNKLLEKCAQEEKTNSELKKNILSCRLKIQSLRRKLRSRTKTHNALRTSKISTSLSSQIQVLDISEHSKIFCGILMGLSKSKKYNVAERELSQNIFYRSQNAYKFLRDRLGFRLPHVSTFYRWAPVKGLQPGFQNNAHCFLKAKFASLSQRERNVVLIFDEIRIRPNLTYNIKNDLIDGFEDQGVDRKRLYGNEICVFMVNGLFDSWKSILNYFVSANSVKGVNLKSILENNLTICQELGLKVCAIVCDQGPNNRKAYQLLGVTEEKPFTIFNNEKIFCFYDFPHLLKSMRNVLLKSDMLTPDGNVSFDVFREIFNLERDNVAKTCLKFTSSHIAPNAFEKMSVRLATETFSRTTAASIQTAHQLNCLKNSSNQALATQAFTLKMNNAFDCMDSGSHYDKNILKRGVQVGNPAYNELKQFLSYLRSMQESTNLPRNFCVKGMVQTINGVLLLSEDISDGLFGKVEYLLTKRTHQDILENLFSIIRSKGGNNKNPSVYEFNVLMSKILSSNLIAFSPHSNCDDDDVEFLNLDTSQTQPHTSRTFLLPEAREETVFDNTLFEKVINEIKITNGISLETTAMRYFTGYLAFKMLLKNKCANCSKLFLKSDEQITCPSEFFIFAKNFSQNSDFGSLLAPTDEFFNICKLHFKVFHTIFRDRPHIRNIRERMALECMRITNLRDSNWFDEQNQCFEHRKEILYFALLILLRKHCAWKIQKRITSKNQKIQILSGKQMQNNHEIEPTPPE